MFNLRDEDDIIKDIKTLNNLVLQYENYKQCITACIKQCNIKEIRPCPNNHKDTDYKDILSCELCKGTKLQVVFNDKE